MTGVYTMNPLDLEAAYQEYCSDLKRFIPDGIVEVDLSLMQELNLLNCYEQFEAEDESMTQHFYVIESANKLTLFNQKFVVWIVPQLVDQAPATYTLIALNQKDKPRLEMAFSTAGVYNQSNLVLRILEKFLEQIEENEEEICRFDGEHS